MKKKKVVEEEPMELVEEPIEIEEVLKEEVIKKPISWRQRKNEKRAKK